jgi:hypothetical protein
MTDDILLEIKDLKINFPLDEGLVRAVEGVNLTVHRGEVLGVVGESGCGKTVTAQSQAARSCSGRPVGQPPRTPTAWWTWPRSSRPTACCVRSGAKTLP